MKHKYSVISRKIKLVHSKEKHMVDKIYNFEKLTPNKEADISVYEEAIDFVFDNADVTILLFQDLMAPAKAVL